MSVEKLARPEIRKLHPYVTAAQVARTVRLNANESPYSGRPALNRYPDIRPARLERRLARLYGVNPARLLATRGSSEAIDMLVRTFCRPGRDNVIVTPPTFPMYQVYADIQGAPVRAVPLRAERAFAPDPAALLAACTDDTRLVFICSPNNPTGQCVPRPTILALAAARAGRSLVVVDEAYLEFSGAGSVSDCIAEHDNVVVLRTLSKAWGLAGARCGAVIASEAVIALLGRVVAPYSFSSPVTDSVLASLADEHIADVQRHVASIVAERRRLAALLPQLACVRCTWPSDSNFLLVRFSNIGDIQRRLAGARILIREFPDDPALADCARITVGSKDENDRLLAVLEECGGAC